MGRLPNKKKIFIKKKKKKSQVGFDGSEKENDNKKGLIAQGEKVIKEQSYSYKPKKGFYVPAFVENSLQFFREVKVELKKVTWPPKNQTMGSTAVVLFLVLIISFFLGIVDIGLSNIARLIY